LQHQKEEDISSDANGIVSNPKDAASRGEEKAEVVT